MNSRFRSLALALMLAGGGVWAQAPQSPPATPQDSPVKPVEPESSLPKQELTGQVLYQFLLAEIAAQRGQFPLAAGAYLDLANTTRDPRIAKRAAEIAFHARQYGPALEAARLWQSLEPDAVQARQLISTLLLASGRVEELADSLSRDLAASGPQVGEALIRLIRAFSRYPDKAAVQRLFDRITEPYLTLPEAHLVRAQAAIGVRDMDRARSEIDETLRLKPSWELAALVKADLIPRGAAQLDYLAGFLAANPDARDVRLGYARSLVAEKRYEASRIEFRHLLASSPDNPDVLYAVGILSLQLNDVAEAEQHLKKFVAIGRGELDGARFYLGQIADQAGRADEALGWYDKVAAGEHVQPARIRAAQVLMRLGRSDEARERISAARQGDPDDIRLLLVEAQLLRDFGRHADAYALLTGELDKQPEQTDLLYETALAAEKLGYYDVLERHLRRLMQLKPDSAQAYNALGYSFADRNQRLDEAAQLIDKALSLGPDDFYILDSKGWLLFRQGKLAEALEMLQKAFAKKPDPEIAAHVGEVLWALGRRDDALKVWREAQKGSPTNDVLATTIKRFVP